MLGGPPLKELLQGFAETASLEYIGADLVHRGADVEGRRERVGAATPGAVTEPPPPAPRLPSAMSQLPYTVKPSTVSFESRRVRWSPSRTSSTAAAT